MYENRWCLQCVSYKNGEKWQNWNVWNLDEFLLDVKYSLPLTMIVRDITQFKIFHYFLSIVLCKLFFFFSFFFFHRKKLNVWGTITYSKRYSDSLSSLKRQNTAICCSLKLFLAKQIETSSSSLIAILKILQTEDHQNSPIYEFILISDFSCNVYKVCSENPVSSVNRNNAFYYLAIYI